MIVTYFIDDKLGGVTSLNYNLASRQGNFSHRQEVVHLDRIESPMTRSGVDFPVDKNTWFRFSQKENYYSVLKRLATTIDLNQEGALVLNYDTELAMLDHYPTRQTTYQLIHDDYNVGLSKKYAHLVDVLICHNTDIHEKLLTLFPNRANSIFYLPHGVVVPDIWKSAGSNERIKLVFLGRMTRSKGIFDLPVISDYLRKAGVKFEWTCIGNGPELNELKNKWNPTDPVEFVSPPTTKEVQLICSRADIFVLPTKFEGSPVSLLETMSVGLVPVITKLAGGITDIVNDDIGFKIPINDNESFAKAILKLDRDRDLMHRLSENCRAKINKEFNVQTTSLGYHELFSRYKDFCRDKKLKRIKVGARLDHPFIPSIMTRLIRTISN